MSHSTANTQPKNSHETDRASEETGEELNETLRLQQVPTSPEELGLEENSQFPLPTLPGERMPTSDTIDQQLLLLLQWHCLSEKRIRRGHKKQLYAELRLRTPALHSANDQKLRDFIKSTWEKHKLKPLTPEEHKRLDEKASEKSETLANPTKRLKTHSQTTAEKNDQVAQLKEPKRREAVQTNILPQKCLIEPPRTDHLIDKTDTESEKIDVHIIRKVSSTFLAVIDEIKDMPQENRPRTYPITFQNQRTDLLQELDYQTAKYLEKREEEGKLTIETIVDAIYCAQLAYQRLTERRYTKVDWKRPLNDKIQRNEHLMCLIDKKRSNQRITKKEKRAVKQITLAKGRDNKKELELDIVRKALEDENDSIRNKVRLGELRTEFSRENYLFETKRGRFYRTLEDKNVVGPELDGKESEILEFWQQQWLPIETGEAWREVIDFPVESREAEDFKIPIDRWKKVIKELPDWKAAGPCKIFNFFIKHLESSHQFIIKVLEEIIIEPETAPKWFFTGNTFLIPKKAVSTDASQFRPITCMSNLYKLLTKMLTEELTQYVEANSIISINQMGTIRRAQGSKEQALFNRAINQQHDNKLYTAWIDVQKAFDSVDHKYLCALIEHLKLPTRPKRFITTAIRNWKLNLFHEGKPLGTTKLQKGILQGDSLSPLLFVLVMEPLTRVLENGSLPRISISTNQRQAQLNHLLFIDDIKLFAKTKEDLEQILDATVKHLEKIGLRINAAKSATNYQTESPHAQEIGKDGTYKYLGIHEDCTNKVSPITKQGIQEELFSRLHKLCQTRLNSRNLFRAINEYALSILNYHIALVDYMEEEFEDIDLKIRTILRTYKIHYQPASLERIYLPRKENGRGLHNVVHKAEKITLAFNQYLSSPSHNIRKDAIWEMELKESSPTALIDKTLPNKYPELENVLITKKHLEAAQQKALKNRNASKILHSQFFTYQNDPIISQKDSPKWLRSGISSPQEEARSIFLQDRNVYFKGIQQCEYCKTPRTLEHVASSCTLALPQYTARHNEILKCVHKAQVIKYGFTLDKRIKRHRIDRVIRNLYADISADVKVETERQITENRPDLVIKDHKRKIIFIVDVAVCHRNGIALKERHKISKYEKIRRELAQRTGYEAVVIPYVISWDGNVSVENWKYRRILGISDKIHSYIQQVALRETVGIVCRDIQGSTFALMERLTEEKVNLILKTHLEEYQEAEEELPPTPSDAPQQE